MQVTGTIKKIHPTEVVSEKFQKRDVIVTIGEDTQYPQDICFQVTQQRVDMLDDYKEGSPATIHFNLQGREWTSPQGKTSHFNTLVCWKIDGEKTYGAGVRTGATNNNAASNNTTTTPPTTDTPADDLPF